MKAINKIMAAIIVIAVIGFTGLTVKYLVVNTQNHLIHWNR